MSKRAGETTIRTSIRIRPCSQQEKETFPGPSPVQAGPGEVRLFQKQYIPGSGRNSPSNLSRSRPATPTSPHVTPRGASSPSLVWRQQAAAQLSNDYQSYPFSNVFGPEEGNEDVYNGSGCRDVVGAVLGGCNGTIFVYGQTGAGKTFTMDAVTDMVLQQLYAAADNDSSNEVAVTISAVELYNEVLRCLLSGRENLQLRWASGAGNFAGVVLEGAEERPCSSIEEAAALVTMAKASRAVGETRANARSSRSHLIVRIKVEVLQLSTLAGVSSPSPTSGSPRRSQLVTKGGKAAAPASVTFSMLNLVDLAGSERIDKSGSADTPIRLREALNINKSLLCLGNVVTALAERSEGKRGNHIPYRDSKLTRLLEDSLGGNATTALIACITLLPEWHLEQSRNTLEFAARAARIVCKPQRNVLNLAPAGGPSGDAANLIAALQAEVAALKKQLSEQQQAPQAPQLHALSVQPVSCSNSLWDGHGVFSSRASGALAGVAEHAAESEGHDSDSNSPTYASCPSSPSGHHSPAGRRGWTNRLRMSLGGGSLFASHDGTLGAALSIDPRGPRSSLHGPSRIPSPKHSLFSALASPRFVGRAATIPHPGTDQPTSPSHAAASGILTHPAQPSAAAGALTSVPEAGGSTSGGGSVPASAHTTSIISRASGTQKSLLWKLLQQPHSHDRHPSGHPLNTLDRISSNGSSRGTNSTHSLQSTGLLITSSRNAASAAAIMAANSSSVLQRWATFSGSRASPVSSAGATMVPVDRAETHDGTIPSHPLQLSPRPSAQLHTGRSSIASRRLTTDGVTYTGASMLTSNSGMAGAKGALDTAGTGANLEGRVAAAEAAMALRDHIIKQLVLALQQKKAEIRSLKEQLAAVLKLLESSEGEEAANKAKLRELAEGIQKLAAARQEEFERWKGHLVGLEAALQAAQKEATDYRDESQSLVQQLTELQARYDSLQTQQRHSLANVALLQQQRQQQELEQQQRQQQEHEQQHEQLAICLMRLQAVESALQDMLRIPCDASSVSRGATPTPRLRGSRPCTPQSPRQMSFRIQQHSIPEHAATASNADAAIDADADAAPATDGTAAATAPAAAPAREHVKGECESHMIQTITTRVFDSSSRLATGAMQQQQQPTAAADVANSLAAAAEEAAAAARLSHVEFVLVELQELMPLVKAAADAALKACQNTAPAGRVPAAAAAAAAAGGVHDGQCVEGGVVIQGLSVLGGVERHGSSVLGTGSTVDNAERKQHDQAVQTKESKASLTGAALLTAAKCHKCESLKPLMVIMQKLKDEVVLLKAAVRTRDSNLVAAEETAAGLRADLLESRQQVGALRERIDELSEDLELARSAAAAAAAAAAAVNSSPAAAGSRISTPRYIVAVATEGCGDQQQEQQQQQQRPSSPGAELSEREVAPVRQVPLMGEDTPLQALHAQILQSWQALAMPFAYRCAFVLGPGSAAAGATSGGSSNNRIWGSSSGRIGSDSPSGSTEGTRVQSGESAEPVPVPPPAAAAEADTAAAVEAAVPRSIPGAMCSAPWSDRVQCQAHVALLACLHQYQEDEPAAAAQQREVLADEARVVEAGLAALPAEHLSQLLQHWGIGPAAAAAQQEPSPAAGDTAAAEAADTFNPTAASAADAASLRTALMSKLWVPGSVASAESLAADSAAACQLALQAAPPAALAAVSLRCNASVIAAASNALADAAS